MLAGAGKALGKLPEWAGSIGLGSRKDCSNDGMLVGCMSIAMPDLYFQKHVRLASTGALNKPEAIDCCWLAHVKCTKYCGGTVQTMFSRCMVRCSRR